MLPIVLSVVSYVTYPCNMSCTHVTCHVPMWCIYVTFQQSGHLILHDMITTKGPLFEHPFLLKITHNLCHFACHMSYMYQMSKVMTQVKYVKYLATHIFLIYISNSPKSLPNFNRPLVRTDLSQVMYPCHKSCTHVTCHASM